MTKPKTASRLAGTINRFLTHKRALGHGFREEARLLRTLLRHVEAGRRRDLDAPGFDRWLRGFRHCHPNTRRKCCEVVRRFCLYRRRHDPGCFVPSADAIPRGQPHAPPVIVEPDQIARMLVLASRFPPTSTSPLRAPALRLALVLLYTCGLRLGELVRLTLGDIAEQDTVLADPRFEVPQVTLGPAVGEHHARTPGLSAAATASCVSPSAARGSVLQSAWRPPSSLQSPWGLGCPPSALCCRRSPRRARATPPGPRSATQLRGAGAPSLVPTGG